MKLFPGKTAAPLLLGAFLALAVPAWAQSQDQAVQAPLDVTAPAPSGTSIEGQGPAGEAADSSVLEKRPGPGNAGASAGPTPSARFGGSGYGLDIAKAVLGFGLVMTLLYFTLRAVGRFGRFRRAPGGRGDFKLRGTLPLDNRKYLAAVEIDGHMLVLGVGGDSVTALGRWRLENDRDQGHGHGHEEAARFELNEPFDDDDDLDISVAAHGDARVKK